MVCSSNKLCVHCDTFDNKGCASSEECHANKTIANDLGLCVPIDCDDSIECPEDWTCERGACVPDDCSHFDCPDGWTCASNQCHFNLRAFDKTLNNITMPLAWTDDKLVMGASTSGAGRIYLVDSTDGSISSSTSDVGELKGLATLGDSKRVAITNSNQTALVDSDGVLVGNGNARCVAGEPSSNPIIHANARFDFGPTLLSVGGGAGNWSFAVPAGDPSGVGWMLAYFPDGNGSTHCIADSMFSGPAITPLAWLTGNQLAFIRDDGFGYLFDRKLWGDQVWGFAQYLNSIFNDVIDIAADDANNMWATVEVVEGAETFSRLVRIDKSSVGNGGHYQSSVHFTSAPAVDEYGDAYVVTRENSSAEYKIRRYASNMVTGVSHTAEGTLAQSGTHLPVGSPILGEPLGKYSAEIYVVTTDGTIYAFNAETLKPLWKYPLGITVAPKAQPLLKDKRLWVASTTGQVRGVPVRSSGLNRTAYWPKMHRDNCNSNSFLTKDRSNHATLESCF
jgi:outer membrane protein assembly factor BamB